MCAKRKLDVTHPDCEEYTRKFTELWNKYHEFEAQERAKYPNWNGKGHPADVVVVPAYRKCCEETKALQQEYRHIFEEVPGDG